MAIELLEEDSKYEDFTFDNLPKLVRSVIKSEIASTENLNSIVASNKENGVVAHFGIRTNKLTEALHGAMEIATDKNISNIQEVAARGGKVVLISDKLGIDTIGEKFWNIIELPKTIDSLNPLLYAIAAQLIAYYTAVAKGTDVDQPRNLAKSVTVE